MTTQYAHWDGLGCAVVMLTTPAHMSQHENGNESKSNTARATRYPRQETQPVAGGGGARDLGLGRHDADRLLELQVAERPRDRQLQGRFLLLAHLRRRGASRPQVRNRPRVRLYGAVPGRRLPGVGRSGASKKIVNHRGIHSDISSGFATCKTHDARHAAKRDSLPSEFKSSRLIGSATRSPTWTQ